MILLARKLGLIMVLAVIEEALKTMELTLLVIVERPIYAALEVSVAKLLANNKFVLSVLTFIIFVLRAKVLTTAELILTTVIELVVRLLGAPYIVLMLIE